MGTETVWLSTFFKISYPSRIFGHTARYRW